MFLVPNINTLSPQQSCMYFSEQRVKIVIVLLPKLGFKFFAWCQVTTCNTLFNSTIVLQMTMLTSEILLNSSR